MGLTGFGAAAFAVVSAGVVAFQLALGLGAPWGSYAMGGAFPGRYPPALRVAAIVQSALIGALALAVLSAGWSCPRSPRRLRGSPGWRSRSRPQHSSSTPSAAVPASAGSGSR